MAMWIKATKGGYKRVDGYAVMKAGKGEWLASDKFEELLRTKQVRVRKWKTRMAAQKAVDKEFPLKPKVDKPLDGWRLDMATGKYVRSDGVEVRKAGKKWRAFNPDGGGMFRQDRVFDYAENAMRDADETAPMKIPVLTEIPDGWVYDTITGEYLRRDGVRAVPDGVDRWIKKPGLPGGAKLVWPTATAAMKRIDSISLPPQNELEVDPIMPEGWLWSGSMKNVYTRRDGKEVRKIRGGTEAGSWRAFTSKGGGVFNETRWFDTAREAMHDLNVRIPIPVKMPDGWRRSMLEEKYFRRDGIWIARTDTPGGPRWWKAYYPNDQKMFSGPGSEDPMKEIKEVEGYKPLEQELPDGEPNDDDDWGPVKDGAGDVHVFEFVQCWKEHKSGMIFRRTDLKLSVVHVAEGKWRVMKDGDSYDIFDSPTVAMFWANQHWPPVRKPLRDFTDPNLRLPFAKTNPKLSAPTGLQAEMLKEAPPEKQRFRVRIGTWVEQDFYLDADNISHAARMLNDTIVEHNGKQIKKIERVDNNEGILFVDG